jgi:hypothetical protein
VTLGSALAETLATFTAWRRCQSMLLKEGEGEGSKRDWKSRPWNEWEWEERTSSHDEEWLSEIEEVELGV